MGSMSASDAAPLPRLGEVFFDVRGSSRSMRLSWYSDTGVAVFSIWQGGTCTGTFRLPIDDLPRMVEALQRGPRGAALPAGEPRDQERGPGAERQRRGLTSAPTEAMPAVASFPEYATGQIAPVTGEFRPLGPAEPSYRDDPPAYRDDPPPTGTIRRPTGTIRRPTGTIRSPTGTIRRGRAATRATGTAARIRTGAGTRTARAARSPALPMTARRSTATAPRRRPTVTTPSGRPATATTPRRRPATATTRPARAATATTPCPGTGTATRTGAIRWGRAATPATGTGTGTRTGAGTRTARAARSPAMPMTARRSTATAPRRRATATTRPARAATATTPCPGSGTATRTGAIRWGRAATPPTRTTSTRPATGTSRPHIPGRHPGRGTRMTRSSRCIRPAPAGPPTPTTCGPVRTLTPCRRTPRHRERPAAVPDPSP